ncbi:coiled-coil domain-containing protein [Paenibacillus cineris]|uniref:N-terminal domain of peptidoglycan hydrolase CwlO-containing protein n=1 Tax=Paenibacillus cineris TaxID=237530 RepID=A0ABQ4LH46_9BACL|nr:hypothetical protein [Paenibacillus cineris]GIO55590.1 hypothetical protein J21TS7_39080 [Paenibacillus cineris]
MKPYNRRLRILCLLLPMLCLSLLRPVPELRADPSAGASTDDREILQNSLSVVEIDREIERITAQQETIQQELNKLSGQLEDKLLQIQDQQSRAGAVIRSYYMGEREGLLVAVLSAKDLGSLIHMYDVYDMIMEHDRTVLDAYQSEYKEIKNTKLAMEKKTADLEEMKSNLIEQRARVSALQQKVDQGIASSSDPEALKKMIEEFTLYWENVGLNEVKTYFNALASAMNDLPEFIQNQDGAIRTNGTTYNIDIKEDDLNAFLRSKNDLFKQFAFHFGEDEITASGQSGTLSLEVQGHYSVEEQPQNSIMFHVDKLVFNGYELPDTTCRQMEEEFDLGFYPQQIVSFVKATEVKSTDKNLHVTLKLSM